MTRSPASEEPPVEGGGAAERLREFQRARFGDNVPDPEADEADEADEATPEQAEPHDGSC